MLFRWVMQRKIAHSARRNRKRQEGRCPDEMGYVKMRYMSQSRQVVLLVLGWTGNLVALQFQGEDD